MIELRPLASLGTASEAGVEAQFHFSFERYHDPARTNWGRLRAWNAVRFAPGARTAPHTHHDMEIVTCVHEGAVTYADTEGHSACTGVDEIQVISAGAGIVHGESNAQATRARCFEIWILPDRRGGAPTSARGHFSRGDRAGRLVALASGQPCDAGSPALPLRADARVLGACLEAGRSVTYDIQAARHAYLVATQGRMRVADPQTHTTVEAQAGDGVAITGLSSFGVTALEDGEIVLVDTA
ncbi:pirin family protein [Novosphingobium sp. 1949]|uniref:Pirin family protein n=1 Tax=Novosphingobium organovorum TaxID=2930092 RepID=A0ABT0BDS5_9SPHN|nr:pirin family protein [Novosphingobium organovorum]MCJ2183144.1 pirin family protein [Novosphingobium organovorum]